MRALQGFFGILPRRDILQYPDRAAHLGACVELFHRQRAPQKIPPLALHQELVDIHSMFAKVPRHGRIRAQEFTLGGEYLPELRMVQLAGFVA